MPLFFYKYKVQIFNNKIGKYILKILAVLSAVIVLTVAVSALFLYTGNRCRKGVTVNNIELSGLTKPQAEVKLKQHFRSLYAGRTVPLKYSDRTWHISMDDIDLEFDIEEAIDKAFLTGRTGGYFKRLFDTVSVFKNGINYSCEFEYDIRALESEFEKIKKTIDIPADNALVNYRDGQFEFTDEKPGLSLDIKKSLIFMDEMISSQTTEGFELPVETVLPEIAKKDVNEINSIVSDAKSFFDKNNNNRVHNIVLAAKRISGRAILPGQVFSMNSVLGSRTADNGYKEAPIIFKKELVNSIGGGICQVSSTLYISALKAGLDIVERKPHSLSLNYVPPGQDATIAEDYIDLKIRNNLDYAVAVQARVIDDHLEILLLGKKTSASDTKIELKSDIIEEKDPGEPEYILDETLSEDSILVREEKKGLRVIVWRETFRGDKLIAKEKVSDDVYNSVPALYKVSKEHYEKNKDKIKLVDMSH